MFNTIRAVWIALVLTIATGRAAADDSCFPHDFAVVQTNAYVRESNDFVSRGLRDVKAGDTFAVTGSTQDSGHCWIKTSVGWLYNGYVEAVITVAPTPTAQGTEDSCWPHDRAIATRNTYIRESHNFGGRIVRDVKPDDTFVVTGSKEYAAFCWIKTSVGWLYSGYVEPVITPTSTAQETRDGCWPHDRAIATRNTYIRESHNFGGRIVRDVKPDDTFVVTGSKEYAAFCWIKTNVGWLYSGYVEAVITVAPTPTAQDEDDGCYQYAFVNVNINTRIRASHNYDNPYVSTALAGESYQVRGSKVVRGKCWIRIREGWLPVHVVEDTPPEATATLLAQGDDEGCYGHTFAYVIRKTAIRESYGLKPRQVSTAIVGDSYYVSGVKEDRGICWIKTSAGWISAQLVSATPPSCYKHEGAFVIRDTTLKASYGFTSKTVGSAKPGDLFDVMGSRKYGQHCWIETSTGWLFADYIVDAYDRCYALDVATVTRQTAIRESYGFAYRSLAEARAGDTFSVMRSKLESGDCWLETSDGWLYGGVVEAVPPPEPTPEAQTTRDGCYPHALATVIRRWRLQASPSIDGDTLDHAEVGDTLEVLQSREIGIYCWLETSAGWLPQRAVSSTPPTPAPTGCYLWDIAYVAGQMNIRRSHSTASPVVAQANAGDILEVSGSAQGESYCWVEIEAGWMAQTQLVRSSISVPALPEITGDDGFRQDIISALHFLRDKLPHWYLYVARVTGRIEPAPRDADTSQAWATGRRITMHDDHLRSPLQAASILAHESCHFVQYNEGRRPGRWDTDARVEHEKECLRIELRVIEEVEPRGRLARAVRDTLNQPDWAFRMAMW